MNAAPPRTEDRAMASTRRQRRRRLFLVLIALVVLNFIGIRVDYCQVCGKRRTTLLGVISYQANTGLSRLLLPYLPKGSCSHKWVWFGRGPFIAPSWMLGHDSRARQDAALASSEFVWPFEQVAKRDGELACAMARTLLYPYDSFEQFGWARMEFHRVAVVFLHGATEEDISRLRRAYGLPAHPPGIGASCLSHWQAISAEGAEVCGEGGDFERAKVSHLQSLNYGSSAFPVGSPDVLWLAATALYFGGHHTGLRRPSWGAKIGAGRVLTPACRRDRIGAAPWRCGLVS